MMKGCATIREGSLKRWQRGTAACLLAICALFFCAPSLFGQESYREFEQGLNLSDSQRAQVDGIKRKYMGEWRALKDESARKRLELRELRRDRPDQREGSKGCRGIWTRWTRQGTGCSAVRRRGIGGVQR